MDKLIYLVPVMGVIGLLYTLFNSNGFLNKKQVLTG